MGHAQAALDQQLDVATQAGSQGRSHLIKEGELLQGPVLPHGRDGQVFGTSEFHFLLWREIPRVSTLCIPWVAPLRGGVILDTLTPETSSCVFYPVG